MLNKRKFISFFAVLVLLLVSLQSLPAIAADTGEPGAKPLDFSGACLTTITGNTSTTGTSIIDSENVPLRPTIKMLFDKNIVNEDVWNNNQQCFTMQNNSGTNVPINISRILDTVNFEERNNVFISPLNDLLPGTTYKIMVSGNLTGKNGVKMGEEVVVTFGTAGSIADTAAPIWPAGTSLDTANVTETTLTLSWSAATDNTAVTGYKVYQGSTLLDTTETTSFNVTGLTAATQYIFKVEAGDAAGNWSTSGPSKTVTTPEGTLSDTKAPVWPPYSIFCFRVSNLTSNSLTLKWNPATDNTAVKRYRVYQGSTLLGTVNTTSFNVTGLTAGTRYFFKVEAGDTAGNWSTNGPCKTVITPFKKSYMQFRQFKHCEKPLRFLDFLLFTQLSHINNCS